MQNYLDLLADIAANGTGKDDRTGIGSRSVFGRLLRWDLSAGFPIITTRKVPLRFAFEETMFFLRGETDTKKLEAKNINIWTGNTTREFLDARGLNHLPEGDMGKGYGAQWTNWETPVLDVSGTELLGYKVYQKVTTNQVAELLDGIRKDPNGRRHVITGWNPGQLSEAALPPCHLMNMYSVANGKLHSTWIQRSTDVPFGLPFNIMSYALMNHIFAAHLGLTPGELVFQGWDNHIYNNQTAMVATQLERDIRALPTLKIHRELTTYADIMTLQWEDIELIGYDPHPDIKDKPGMAT